MKREILSGNEAIARGAFEAGVRVAVAYPGTPSTEILENTVNYPSIDSSWAPNEKVALEVGIGACFGGARSLVAMKHVGVNVAADPLFTLAYTGVKGGWCLQWRMIRNCIHRRTNRIAATMRAPPRSPCSNPLTARKRWSLPAWDLR